MSSRRIARNVRCRAHRMGSQSQRLGSGLAQWPVDSRHSGETRQLTDASDQWRIGLPFEVTMPGQRFDIGRNSRGPNLRGVELEQPRILSAAWERLGNSGGVEQRGRSTERQDCLAVPILILQKLECVSALSPGDGLSSRYPEKSSRPIARKAQPRASLRPRPDRRRHSSLVQASRRRIGALHPVR